MIQFALNWLSSRHFRAGYRHARKGGSLSEVFTSRMGWNASREFYYGFKA